MSTITSRPVIKIKSPEVFDSLSSSRISHVDLQSQRRLTIMKLVRRRAAETFKDARDELKEKAECLSKTKAGRITQSIFNIASQTMSVLFSPIALYGDLSEIRKAWHVYRKEPSKRDQLRAETLLNMFTTSMNVGTVFAPAICGICGSLADAAKMASEVDKIGKIIGDKPHEDRLQTTIKLIANAPGLKKALDLFLFAGGEADLAIGKSLKSLKQAFRPDADIQEQRLALKGLKEFYKVYSKYYPKVEQERFQSMVEYLRDKNDNWNAHLIEADGKVEGGFTCYHLSHPVHGKTLFVEQIVPPFSQNPRGYKQAWDQIIKLARENGTQRIWVEARKDEPVPGEFREASLFHIQPVLKGRIGQSSDLRMCVMDINSSKPVTHNEYHDVVIDCILSWAEKSDPTASIFKDRIPKNNKAIPYKPKSETDQLYDNYVKTLKI